MADPVQAIEDRKGDRKRRCAYLSFVCFLFVKLPRAIEPFSLHSVAFGIVYKANWRMTAVAVKVLNREHMTQKNVADFHHEAELMRSLRPHANVCVCMSV